MRIEGRVVNSQYVVSGPTGVMKQIPLEQARSDPKLQAAIRRNNWETVPNG